MTCMYLEFAQSDKIIFIQNAEKKIHFAIFPCIELERRCACTDESGVN